jgi:hypothetical protein
MKKACHRLLLAATGALVVSSVAIAGPLTSIEINNLLVCYQSEFDKKNNGIEKYDLAFSQFPKGSFYKLFIDKHRLEKPEKNEQQVPAHMLFDVEEPGYYASMVDAFSVLPQYLGKKLTLESIVELHDIAVGKIKGMKKGFGGDHHYDTYYSHVDPEAYLELMKSGILYSPMSLIRDMSEERLVCGKLTAYNGLVNSYLPHDKWKYYATASSSYEVFRIASLGKRNYDKLLDHYYTSVGGITSLSGKLLAISELLRALEVAHFLPDGNQRTYSFLILNKLLIEQSIPYVILEDPTMFDGFMTVEEMSQQLKVGIVNFLNENSDGQREFLKENCSDLKDASNFNYITDPGMDYTPFYQQGQIDTKEVVVKLKYEIDTAISNGRVNEKNSNYDSPLDVAIFIGSIEYVNKLLESGADPFGNQFETWSEYPYRRAKNHGSLKIAKLFLEKAKKENINQKFIQAAIYDEARSNVDASLKEHKEHWKELIDLMNTLLNLATEDTLKNEKVLEYLKKWKLMILGLSGDSRDKVEEMMKKHNIHD